MESKDVPEVSRPDALTAAKDLDYRRTTYYILILCGMGLTLLRAVLEPAFGLVAIWLTVPPALACSIVVAYLVSAATLRAGFRVWAAALIGLLLLVPLVNLITLMIVDFQIADKVERLSTPVAEQPRLSRMSYWSLLLFWLPPIGLTMAIVSLFQIRARRGLLTGKSYAIAGLIVNAIMMALLAWMIYGICTEPPSQYS